MTDNPLISLTKSTKTIFTAKELAILWNESNLDALKSKISYYIKKGHIQRIQRGIYAKNRQYNPLELAVSIYIPSYISFETILHQNGINFQYYSSIFVAGKRSAVLNIQNHNIQLRKLKKEILYNTNGLIHKETYTEASTERAFLDLLYLKRIDHLDNANGIDWNRCDELAPLYHNQQLIHRLETWRNQFEEKKIRHCLNTYA